MPENAPAAISSLYDLYEQDETAWLEQTADLVARGLWNEVDREHLVEYLNDMARRDRREVVSRLKILLAHRLKWQFQSEKRTKSWQRTMLNQRHELEQIVESGSLRKHAEENYSKAYRLALEMAATETGLAPEAFPADPPWPLEEVLANQPT
jgi:hypothetical protein